MARPYRELFTEDVEAIPWKPIEGSPGLYEKYDVD